ncbi:hypothetical protein H8356DRAFT_982673 [Neocallimastix lanati (nom. inval.)]|nr:hypothetical protein H8356DRAFT_982673 [Neocallimastix sp. JGI-2020a]
MQTNKQTKKKKKKSFLDLEDTLLSLKQNKGKNLFRLVGIFGRFYMLLSIFTFISLFFVKDSNVFGAKFECITTSLLIFIFGVINGVLIATVTTDGDITSNNHRRMFLDFFEATNGGKILFTIVSSYILFTSITLPVIQYFIAKKTKDRSTKEASQLLRSNYNKFNSKEAFKEVLKTPTFVYQLRNIAIKEFSVENVLFWENYKILQNMNHRYFVETKKAEELGNVNLVDLYDFEGYYQEQIQYYNTTVEDSYSYNSNLSVPAAIIPYYDQFYRTFIKANCPAKVNISYKIVKAIESEIVKPTVGIFDVAKDEVVDMMYNSIYPIFLKKNKKQLEETFNLNK